MAKSNFNDMPAAEIGAKCRELRQELFNLRLQQATARLEKPHRIRDIRREVARGETQMSQLSRVSKKS